MRSPYASRLSTGSLAPQPWHGVDPGALLYSDRGASGLCTVVQVRRPSAMVQRIAERGRGAAPEPRYVTLSVGALGVYLHVDVPWWDIEGKRLC
jgi:hypothetical protein